MPRQQKQIETLPSDDDLTEAEESEAESILPPPPAKIPKVTNKSSAASTSKVPATPPRTRKKKNPTPIPVVDPESEFDFTFDIPDDEHDTNASKIDHKLQIGTRDGIGLMKGNIVFFKHWKKDGKLNVSKWPFEINPNLVPYLISSLNTLTTHLNEKK